MTNSANPAPEANSLEGWRDDTVPLTGYSMRGNPRGGPGVRDVEGYAPPGLRRGTLARTSVSTDPSGAALNIVGSVNRVATLRDYLNGQPAPYDPGVDRTGMRVMENRTSASSQPLWQARQRQHRQQGR